MDAFEIAWFSSAFAFAYLVYAFEPFEPPEPPKDPSLIPIKANGRDIHVPPGFVDVMSDISKFATKFELALKKAVPGLKSSSGTLWTARIVRGRKPELEKALQGMDKYVLFFPEILSGVDAFDPTALDVIIQPYSTELSTLTIVVRNLNWILRDTARSSE